MKKVCLSNFLLFVLVLGCSYAPVVKQDIDSLSESSSIVWGSISPHIRWNFDTYKEDFGGLLDFPRLNLNFVNDKGKVLTVKPEGTYGNFVIILPEGKYRLNVEYKGAFGDFSAFASRSIVCAGGKKAIYIGSLDMGTKNGQDVLVNSPHYFERDSREFLKNNPNFRGEIIRNEITDFIRPR